MSAPNAEFDIIFAGGGTASCLTASRLSDADPSLKILIVEAGPHIQEDLAHTQPARYFGHLVPTSNVVAFLVGNPEPNLGGRPAIIPYGQCVGGGSSINFMMYTRASASDYDDWEHKFGNPGWGSKDLIPLLKKTECYEVTPGKETHGYDGPLKVSRAGPYTNIGRDFIDTATKYEPRDGVTDDTNDLYEINKFARWQKWVDPKTGRRSDVPHYFIYNKNHPNLKIITGHFVKRVLFDGDRATGVEYVPNPKFHPDTKGQTYSARAKHLIVLGAGTFHTPTILERSGIGARSVLEKHGIPVRVDLPGVGEGMHDHTAVFTPYFASDDSETLDGITRNLDPDFKQWSDQWAKDGTGLMASNGIDAAIKLRPTREESRIIGPAFEKRWEEFFAPSPDKPALVYGVISSLVGDPTVTPNCKYFTFAHYLTHQSSTGWVHIRDAADPTVAPEFVTGFLNRPDDLELLRWIYKRSREFARRMPCYRGELAASHPDFLQGSKAVNSAKTPVAIGVADLEYSAADDKAIDDYVRRMASTTWHSLGTASMKPREQGGVVDSALNVYGVKGLKVNDLSVAPGNVAANTYSTTLTIAEKAALIIAAELGIKGV